jgi:hypothetical protein
MRQICALTPKSLRQGDRPSIQLIQNHWSIIDAASPEAGRFPGFSEVRTVDFGSLRSGDSIDRGSCGGRRHAPDPCYDEPVRASGARMDRPPSRHPRPVVGEPADPLRSRARRARPQRPRRRRVSTAPPEDSRPPFHSPPEVLAQSPESRRGIPAADCEPGGSVYEVRRLQGGRIELREAR